MEAVTSSSTSGLASCFIHALLTPDKRDVGPFMAALGTLYLQSSNCKAHE